MTPAANRPMVWIAGVLAEASLDAALGQLGEHVRCRCAGISHKMVRSRFVTRRESPTEAPNYYLRTASGQKTAITSYTDPPPQLRRIRKQLVRYKGPDGVDLSFTLYLPPDYKEGTRLPTLVYAYPAAFRQQSAATAARE